MDLSGQKFNRLTVIKLYQKRINTHTKTKWECKCDCGNIKVIEQGALKAGLTQSCGCLQKDITRKLFRKEKGESGFSRLKKDYIIGAKSRNLIFELTDLQLRSLFKDKCYYCEIEPHKVTSHTRKSTTIEAITHSQYTYNGIDRLNNIIGYTLENSVSCCKICNTAKSNLTLEEFITWLQRITQSNNWKKLIKVQN